MWSTGDRISRSLRKNYVGTHAHRRSAQLAQHEHGPAGCSKRPSSKAAASEGPRRTLGYVEGLNDARTLLADFFSSLLAAVLYVQGYLRNTPPLHRRLDPYISLCHQGL